MRSKPINKQNGGNALTFVMNRRILNVNTENAIKIFDEGWLKVTRSVPEKHIIIFLWH